MRLLLNQIIISKILMPNVVLRSIKIDTYYVIFLWKEIIGLISWGMI